MLEARIKRLERCILSLLILLVGAIAAGNYKGAYGVYGTVDCDLLRAKTIKLEDAKGNVIGQWWKDPDDGSCQFVMSDVSVSDDKPARMLRMIVEKDFLQVILQEKGKDGNLHSNSTAITLQGNEPVIMTQKDSKGWVKVN